MKKLVKLASILLISAVGAVKIYAATEQPQFLTDYDIRYDIQPNGETLVTQNLMITNQKNDIIATSYAITIKNLDVYGVEATSEGKEIEVNEKRENETTKLTANFKKYVIGEGRQNDLTIKYKSKDIATKVGEVWNINIPQTELATTTTRYNVRITIPKSFGPKIYVSPAPTLQEENETSTIINYTKDAVEDTGITASFGQYQYLNFRLRYQLRNPYYLSAEYEIALPADIPGVQQVSYADIYPKPKKIYRDDDGNTIAVIKIWGKKDVEVEVRGAARITGRQITPGNGGSFEDLPRDLVKTYTQPKPYWEVDSEAIKKLAEELYEENLNVSENAQVIYNYVIDNLDYDFDVINEDFIDRKGAQSALLQRGAWACMEFTDLFIATARAMGIPARELNGYAFTGTDRLKPLSISFRGGDLLHAWPEFYDPNFGWVQIDPTWGNTSGIDYFTKLDTNHFTFVVKGKDSEYPLPAGAYRLEGSENERLVEVDFSENVSADMFKEELEYEKKFTLNIFQLLKGNRKFKVTNTGKVIVYDALKSGKNLAPGESIKIYNSEL